MDDDGQDAAGGIAIIGMAGRFPGARNIAEFWRNLCAGVESVTRFQDSELEDSFDAQTRAAANFVKARPILENIELFDAPFFGMHARETELTDPQHRLFLECTWEALEDAGYDPARYTGAIGVFAGSSPSTYFLHNVLADRATIDEFTSNYQVGCYPMLLGAGQEFLSTRVSYKLGLTGPSLTLQAACATSLLAIAKACQSLSLYESDMALAGGVSVTFPQRRGYQHLDGGMVSADGTCRPFDADASGTIFGSGAGVVLLKRLDDARSDGDHIYAVIRGSGVNNDGATKVGFTAPSSEGQAAVIRMALANAGVEARSISYVECHGTATPLGDPIEVAGLTNAYRDSTDEVQFCALGSVKSNIGHLDAAAGVTGLIKTALALKHRLLPPTLHYRRPNKQIDFASTPFFVNDKLTAWADSSTPRRAGVSAFGVGGTNVHVVLEEALPQRAAEPRTAGRAELIVLSARSASALTAARANLAAFLREESNAARSDRAGAASGSPALTLAGVAFTSQVGRRAFDHRLAFVARDCADALATLERSDAGVPTGVRTAKDVRAIFMFPGQGSQYPNMGRDLFDSEPVFRREIERCALILKPLMAEELCELLYPTLDAAEARQRLMATVAAQPAIFSVEYALAKLWMSWGVQPAAMIGHSVGEFVAAVLAGVLSLEDALTIVAARGRLMQELPGGAMLAVRLAEADVRPLLASTLSIAAINGPALCVVSGPYEAVDALEKTLASRSVVSRRLHTSHAFHSAMVEPVVEPLRRLLEQVQLSAPSIPYVSCVSGTWIRADEATSPQYWAGHARAAVRFADGIATVSADGACVLLELGPGNALSTLALQNTRGRSVPVVSSMQGIDRSANDRDFLLEAVGRAWIAGIAPDWAALHGAGELPSRVTLPTYPFERSRHWIDPPGRSPTAIDTAVPILNQDGPMNDTSPDRTQELRRQIAAIFENLSGETPASIDADTTFLEMGYDSLFLTQVAQKIQSQTGVKITFRQLLGDYSSIPTLAAFLDGKMPRAAAPQAAPKAASPVTATLASATAAAASASPSGVEGIFREQLQAMTQLINRQFDMLQALGAAPAAMPVSSTAPAPPAGAAVTPAATAPGASPAYAAAASVTAATSVAAATTQPSRFEVFVPEKKKVHDAGRPEYKRHIDALIARYTAKTPGSKRETAAYRSVSADPRVAAGFRPEWKEMVYPLVVKTCAGSKLVDVDGNEYIDLVNGFGQTAFGHAPAFVVKAVKEQLDLGFAIGPQAELTGKVAKLFCEMTGNERMAFCNTGSEAVMAAMRVARTVTGRDKIVIFNGDYHGQFDEVLVKGVQRPGTPPRSMPVAPGIPGSAVENMIVLEYGSAQSLQWIRDNAQELAAVIVEPVQSRHPNTRPFEFLREVRAITAASGTAFVMDEVVTGFRVHPGGMQAVLGIRADLATYGKVVGGGLPVGVLAGKSQFMDALDGGNWNYGDDSFPETGVTFFAGTFVRHPLLLASAWAVLNHLKDRGPALQETLSGKTARLVDKLNALFRGHGIATKIESYSSWFYFNLHNEHPLATLLYYHLRERGIHIQEGFPCFLTTAHSDADFDRIYAAFESTIEEMNSVGILGTASTRVAAEPALAETTAAAALPRAIIAPAGAVTPPAGDSRPVPLTESQVEIWLAAQLGDEASCAFNESVSLRLQGQLDVPALQAAMTEVAARHDALRMTFSSTGEEIHIAAPRTFAYPVTDLSAQPAAEAELAYAELVAADARTAFDLIDGPTVRAHLVKLAQHSHVFLFTAHHIVCDGWSINVVINELAEIYASLCRGEAAALAPALPFSAYARSQATRDPAQVAATEAYWLEEFKNPVQPLELPTDRPRPTVKSFNGASLCRRIDAALYQAIKKAGARQRSTLFVTLLAAFQTLMGRLADQTEVVVGVPTAGQSMLEDQILVGHCVNFLPLRGSWNRETRVSEYLSATAKRVLDAYEHQDTTFGTLVRKLALPRQPGRLPLAEIQFNLERLSERIQLPNLTMDVAPNAKAYVNFDLFLNVIESADGLRMDCDYNTDLFDAATIDHWLDCYQALLEAIVADAAQPLSAASCIPAAELERVLEGLNDTAAEYPLDACVHQLIEAQAAATPDAVAAQFGAENLTYRALDRRANRLAHVLRARLQKSGSTGRLVGVACERSLDMLVALIAVHKAGCAYVPLDPLHPAARLRYILAEAEVAALICDGSEEAALVGAGIPVIDMRKDVAAIAAASHDSPARAVSAQDLAYVIYTSGSTGLPKGVEITHRAVVNLLSSMAKSPGLTRGDVLYAVTTISFDIAGLELFLPLIVGAKVVIAERDALMDGYRLLKELESTGATTMQATPASWRLLLEAGFRAKSGFKMLCGGEALPRELAARLMEGSGELWNMYGPTETTIWSSCGRPTPSGPVTVGGPIANTQFYILDKQDQPVPQGVPGQLHIGGDGVARGYYKRAELTAEKFISNPFMPGRLYRTGDLARWLPDGSLQVLGRIDHQIKLRGFRIELGEIESVLMNKAQVAEATVVLREDRPGAPRLVAYYVERAGDTRTPDMLHEILADDMPDYMIPTAWVRLETLPLSPNGKLDRAALPVPDSTQTAQEEFVAPTTPTEIALTKIFGEVLNMERVGATADLLKMGADSIQIFQITARANRAGIKITAKQLLQHRTAVLLSGLADAVQTEVGSAGASPLPTLGQFQRNRRSGSNSGR